MGTTEKSTTKEVRYILGEEVRSLQSQVLDNQIQRVVGVFDTRDGDVSNFLDDGRKDDTANVSPKLRLEGQVAISIKEQILGEALPISREPVEERIIAPSLEPSGESIEEVVHVTLVLVGEVGAARVGEFVPAASALRGEDVAGFEEGLLMKAPNQQQSVSARELMLKGVPAPFE